MVDAKFDGIVSAGVGNGNLYHTLFDTLAKASKDGIRVVRSARVPTGATTLDAEIDDAKYGFVASGTLNPQKARVLLMLSLTQSKDPAQISALVPAVLIRRFGTEMSKGGTSRPFPSSNAASPITQFDGVDLPFSGHFFSHHKALSSN